MSLCFATVTMSGLLVATDGVAITKNYEIVKNDQEKIFKITDNLAVFISGEKDINLEVIDILKNEEKEKFSSLEKANETIKEACKTVYKKHKDNIIVKVWEWQNQNKEVISEQDRVAIPISLTAFYYDTAYHCTNFIPPKFEPDHEKMRPNQTFIHGFKNNEAGKILRKTMNNGVKSLQSEIENWENCYREIENQYKGVGGNTKYFLMTNDSFSLIKEMKKE